MPESTGSSIAFREEQRKGHPEDMKSNDETVTSISMREEPTGENSALPPQRQQDAQHDISFHGSTAHNTNTQSHDDIHFTAADDVLSTSQHSVAYQIEESRMQSRANPNRLASQSPPPPSEQQQQQQPAAEVNAGAVPKQATEAAIDAPAGGDGTYAVLPPPRRLSQRALTAARTPRSLADAPTTPRTRSPNNSHRPQVQPAADVAEAAAATAGVPPRVPGSERASAVEPATAPAAHSYARASTAASDFSTTADADPAPAGAAPTPTPAAAPAAAPDVVAVTQHARHFSGDGWEDVVASSLDTVERTVGNEAAAAVGVEPQYVRVQNVTATAAGMTCDISVAHAAALTADETDEKLRSCPFDATRTLLAIRTARREQPQYGLGGVIAASEGGSPAAALPPQQQQQQPEPEAVVEEEAEEPRPAPAPTAAPRKRAKSAKAAANSRANPSRTPPAHAPATNNNNSNGAPKAAAATTAAWEAKRIPSRRAPSHQRPASVATHSPQPSAARARREQPLKSLPRLLVTPRVFHARTPRPSGEASTGGESVLYITGPSEGSARGQSRHSVSVATPRRGLASSARRSPSAPTHTTDTTTLHLARSIPPQHIQRGVPSLALRQRPIIHVTPSHPQHRAPPPALADDTASAHRSLLGVEHMAETPSASRRSRSPQQPPLATAVAVAVVEEYDTEEVAVQVVQVARIPISDAAVEQEDYILMTQGVGDATTTAAEVGDEDDADSVSFEDEPGEAAPPPQQQQQASTAVDAHAGDEADDAVAEHEAAPAEDALEEPEAVADVVVDDDHGSSAAAAVDTAAAVEEDEEEEPLSGEPPRPHDAPVEEEDVELPPQQQQQQQHDAAAEHLDEEDPVPAAAPNPFV
ncbi:hypothetical protein NESM_000088200 [Novymonas esmeraldas]|uniref:Flagellar attachment zone protein 1 conserved domain-containing protein n=1 Tax=Novymonas esmeraldas TaxID=1808958 RepID=A0AAW0F3X4_9TRYP